METPVFTLFQLNNIVRQTLEGALPDTYWVTGELLQGGVGSGGHFYGELIQKDERTNATIAKARLNIWAGQFVRIRAHFESETGQTLRSGIKIQVLVRVTFHEQYGFSLVGLDIDSTYTLGDQARRRREILQKLKEEGILNDNKTLTFPRLLNRIAIISSETAAGYGDFCDQLHHNDYGLHFTTKLFPALMQGQHTEESVLAALDALLEEENMWDAVVVIRGGGATSDLADFESYALASAVAQFPIPIIVGIGHERDETVLDFVAHTRVKTPTAAAAFLVDHQKEELFSLEDFVQRIPAAALLRLQKEKLHLDKLSASLPFLFSHLKERVERHLTQLEQRATIAITRRIERERSRVELLIQRHEMLDPKRLLQLGYSITICNGRLVRNATSLKPGDEVTTQFEKGSMNAIVKKTSKQ